MQSKAAVLTSAWAVNAHEMVLGMGLSICTVTCEEVHLRVRVLEIDGEGERVSLGAQRGRGVRLAECQ